MFNIALAGCVTVGALGHVDALCQHIILEVPHNFLHCLEQGHYPVGLHKFKLEQTGYVQTAGWWTEILCRWGTFLKA
jgi:hypothetical protein